MKPAETQAGHGATLLRSVGLSLLLAAVVVAPRLPGLRSFVAVDEPAWLSRGGNFYYALGQREFEKTVYEYHPGVTTMWLVTFGYLAYFPEYRGLGQGYFDIDKQDFDPFLAEHGRSPLLLLYYGRLLQLGLILVMALVIFHLLRALLGEVEGWFVTAFVLSGPLLLGYSRVLDHEAMVVAFLLVSVLSMSVYLEGGRKRGYVLLSGAAAAFANLTKSSALLVIPVVGTMLLVSALRAAPRDGWRNRLQEHVKTLGYWLASMIVAYVVVWPGMWVKPTQMLAEVYGNALSYAFQGARLQVTGQLEPQSFGLERPAQTLVTYAGELLWRSTPLVWLGMLLALPGLTLRAPQGWPTPARRLAAFFLLAALLFVLMFSFAQGRNSPHYILTSHASLNVIAAMGWVFAFRWLVGRSEAEGPRAFAAWAPPGLTAAVVALQLAAGVGFYPYFYTYSNPIARFLRVEVPPSDYGEGFENAAAYLAAKPGADALTAFSFRGRGPFSYFFPGTTLLLNPLFMEEPTMGSMVSRLEQSDYLVFNDAMLLRTRRTAEFGSALRGIAPEVTLQTRGAYDIHIYRVDNLTPEFYQQISN